MEAGDLWVNMLEYAAEAGILVRSVQDMNLPNYWESNSANVLTPRYLYPDPIKYRAAPSATS